MFPESGGIGELTGVLKVQVSNLEICFEIKAYMHAVIIMNNKLKL